MSSTLPTVAYSYMRYSSDPQGDGDSIRRQTDLARGWCERNNAQLNTTTTYTDHGTSALRGKHRETGKLAAFLADVEAERIPRGSVLVVENLDRLSRESPWDAVPLLCSIVNAGVAVVTLSPSEVVYRRGKDLTPLILAVVEFGRANSESETKSGRTNENWTEKKRQARVDKRAIVTRRLPAWVQEKNGKLVAVPERVKIVRQLFKLALEGYGLFLIVNKLTADKVPTWGRAAAWSKQYVHKILTGRTVLGEYQPMKAGLREDKDGKPLTGFVPVIPDGEPILGYYPAVVDVKTWEKVQSVLAGRKGRQGRIGEKVTNLFTGMISDAKTRDKYRIAWQTRGSGKNRQKARVLVSSWSMEGRIPSVTFPYLIFESAVLSMLREVKASDVIGNEPPSESVTIASELADVESRRRKIEAELAGEGEDIPALVRVLKTLDEKCQELLRRLAIARQKEANPQGQAWSEAQSLLDAAKDGPHRLRLRGLLQTIIESINVLVVATKSRRIAVVQIDFKGGSRRHYAIDYKPANRSRKGSWEASSIKSGPLAAMKEPDLKNPKVIQELEPLLLASMISTEEPAKAKRKPKRKAS